MTDKNILKFINSKKNSINQGKLNLAIQLVFL
jgi:hypothetical protein